MLTPTVIAAAIVALIIYIERVGSNSRPTKNRELSYSNNAGSYKSSRSYGGIRGPIFSPGRGYLWDGEKWIRNNGGLDLGIFLGIAITLVAGALVYALMTM